MADTNVEDQMTKFKQYKVAELRDHLSAEGLESEGSKKELLERLDLYLTSKSKESLKSARSRSRGTNHSVSVSPSPRRSSRHRSTSRTGRTLSVNEEESPARSVSRGRRRKTSILPEQEQVVEDESDVVVKETGQRSVSKSKRNLTPKRSTSQARSKSPLVKSSVIPKETKDATWVEQNESTNETKRGNKKNKKKKNKRRVIEKRTLEDSMPRKNQNVIVEYVPASMESLGLSEETPGFEDFARIFSKFSGENDEDPVDPALSVSHNSAADGAIGEVNQETVVDRLSEQDDEDMEESGKSKRQRKKENRLTVAQLKQLVDKPEVVEWFDVSANDPRLLLYLKSYRNAVSVPKHWCSKKKYLSNRRGVERPFFELPDFIKATGISEMRQAIKEKEDSTKLKTKARERLQPKMGKLEIDYQKLHDAFFRFQTKPYLTPHGDMYFEGKEFETRMREKRPGVLSKELREALGMTTPVVPPPWLVNMQRVGPPPSYPNLKVPGLNAPIPEGAQWGYHPGGWGKPPVDEYNRPLYGDVFGLFTKYQKQLQTSIEAAALTNPPVMELWGELEPVPEYEEPEEEEEEEGDEELEDGIPMDQCGLNHGAMTPAGLATPSGLSSIATGLATPDAIQLRKEVKVFENSHTVPLMNRAEPSQQKSLYTVIPQKDSSVSGLMGSERVYDMKKRKFGNEQVEVTLQPEELEDGFAANAAIQTKYQEALNAESKKIQKEDLSDMVAEHSAKISKKRKTDERSRKKEFKF